MYCRENVVRKTVLSVFQDVSSFPSLACKVDNYRSKTSLFTQVFIKELVKSFYLNGVGKTPRHPLGGKYTPYYTHSNTHFTIGYDDC